MNLDKVLDPLHRVDRFLRFELVNTLQQPALDPNTDWRVVTEASLDLQRQRIYLSPEEAMAIEVAIRDLQRDLNSVADLMRKIALLKNDANFDEHLYLDAANAAIHQSRDGFQLKLRQIEGLLQQRLSATNLVTPDNKTDLKEGNTRTDRITRRLKNNPVIAGLLVVGLGIIAIGTFTDALDKTHKFLEGLSQPSGSAQIAAKVSEEGRFRIRQIDEVLAAAIAGQRDCFRQLDSTGVVLGSRIRDYLSQAQLVTVAMELGGVYRPPGKAEDTVWIGTSGYALRNLPDRRSYKDSDYAASDFRDLSFAYIAAKSHTDPRASPDSKELDLFLEQLRRDAQFSQTVVLSDWFMREQAQGPYQQRYGAAYKVNDAVVEDYRDHLDAVREWLNTLQKDWEHFKKLKAIVPLSG
jgi:hypothetical protein